MLGNSGLSATAQEKLTPKSAQTALQTLQTSHDEVEGNRLAEQMRTLFGADNVRKGPKAHVEGMTALWAIEVEGVQRPPIVYNATGTFLSLPMTRLGNSNVYAATYELPNGTGMNYTYLVDGKHIGGGQLEAFLPNPDNQPQPGVPKGTLTKQTPWQSKIFENTTHDWWIYVPAQYKPEKPACVMIFQDGEGYSHSVPTVFDNLIAKGDMPITIGIFIQPGNLPQGVAAPGGRGERSFEYDTLSDQYARLLLEEILPEVEKTYKLRHDAQSRAVAGLSSGGICSFTVAWERPNEFSKVLSWIGSFTDIQGGKTFKEGGHNYPFLIRQTDPKPIRVFLQDGANDLDNQFGNWPLANQGMAKALAFKGYDYKFAFGNGFHSGNHGTYLLPESLRWLWHDYKE